MRISRQLFHGALAVALALGVAMPVSAQQDTATAPDRTVVTEDDDTDWGWLGLLGLLGLAGLKRRDHTTTHDPNRPGTHR